MSCQRCGSRCQGRYCNPCARDLRYGNAGADDSQPRAKQRAYRCLDCGTEHRTVDDPCPNCGARHRRYIGPLPGEEDETRPTQPSICPTPGGEHS
jgi:rubrerythrin